MRDNAAPARREDLAALYRVEQLSSEQLRTCAGAIVIVVREDDGSDSSIA